MLWSRQRTADVAGARRAVAARLVGISVLVLAAVTGASAGSDAGQPARSSRIPTSPSTAARPTGGTEQDARPEQEAGSEPGSSEPGRSQPGGTGRGTAPAASAAPDAVPSPGTGPAPRPVAVRAAFDALPAGAHPVTVPYAIGTRVYFRGRVTDLAGHLAATATGTTTGTTATGRQLSVVAGGGSTAWTQASAPGPDGTTVHTVARVGAGGGFTPLHRSTGRASDLAVTSAGLVAVPESGELYGATGTLAAAFTGSPNIDCGFCGATAAGPRLVLDQWTGPVEHPQHQSTWLWYPPAAVQRIDDRFVAVGRLGTGWLGLRLGGGCWRIAPATSPDRLGATVCSLTRPLVGPDGRNAVVVQGGRARVVDPVTGALRSVAALGDLGAWAPTADDPARVVYAVPAAWETGDSYLITARAGTALALVRCSARTGACQRTVRASVRPGVDAVVTERGVRDAVPAG